MATMKSWIVSSRQPDGGIDDLLRRVDGDPAIAVTRVTTLSDGSWIVVLEMSDETARLLKNEVGDRYRIEPNVKLNLS